MILSFSVIVGCLCFLFSGTACAFVPPRTVSSPALWGISQSETRLLAVTSEDIDAFLLLGGKQLKRTARVLKRKANSATALKSLPEKKSPPPQPASESIVGKALKIIIAGAPASGKGTQCEIIKDKYGIVHLSTGDMLRAAVAAETEVGKMAKEYMDSGKLVPDEVIIGVVKGRLESDDCKKNGWLLDGFPRTQAQAAALADAGVSADCFIYLDVPDEVLVERVVGRRTDPETGKIYHMTFSPPEDDEVRDRLVQRSDDTEEKVKVRLEQFHANVEAVKGIYSDISVDIDGTKAPTQVADAICSALSANVFA